MDNSQMPPAGERLPGISQSIDLLQKLGKAELGDYLYQGSDFFSCKNSYINLIYYMHQGCQHTYYFSLFQTALDTILKKLSDSVAELSKKTVRIVSEAELALYKTHVAELKIAMDSAIQRVSEIKEANKDEYYFKTYEYDKQFGAFIKEVSEEYAIAIGTLNMKESDFQLSTLKTSELAKSTLPATPAAAVLPSPLCQPPQSSGDASLAVPMKPPAPQIPSTTMLSKSEIPLPPKAPRFDVLNYVHPVFTFTADHKSAQNLAMLERTCLKGEHLTKINSAKADFIQARELYVAFVKTLSAEECTLWKNECLDAVLNETGIKPSIAPLMLPAKQPEQTSAVKRGGPPPPPPPLAKRGGPPPPPPLAKRGGPPPPPCSMGAQPASARKNTPKPIPELTLSATKRIKFVELQSNYSLCYSQLLELLIDKSDMPKHKLTLSELTSLSKITEAKIAELKDKPKKTTSAIILTKTNSVKAQNPLCLEIKKGKDKITELDNQLKEISSKRSDLNQATQKENGDFEKALQAYEETLSSFSANHKIQSANEFPSFMERYIARKLELLKTLALLVKFEHNTDGEFASCLSALSQLSTQKEPQQKELFDKSLVLLESVKDKLFKCADQYVRGINDGTILLQSPSVPSIARSKISHSSSSPAMLKVLPKAVEEKPRVLFRKPQSSSPLSQSSPILAHLSPPPTVSKPTTPRTPAPTRQLPPTPPSKK